MEILRRSKSFYLCFVNLTAYDAEFNQLGEAFVPQLTKKPAKHFAKDGQIWIYENIAEEMGFVRLKIPSKTMWTTANYVANQAISLGVFGA